MNKSLFVNEAKMCSNWWKEIEVLLNKVLIRLNKETVLREYEMIGNIQQNKWHRQSDI